MPRDYDADAAKFVDTLPADISDGIDVPNIFVVRETRCEEFPILKAGVEARGRALRASAGNEFSLTTLWGGDTAITRETRMAGKADGKIVLQRPSKAWIQIPFSSEPGKLTIGDVSFSASQEDEMANHLDALLSDAVAKG